MALLFSATLGERTHSKLWGTKLLLVFARSSALGY